MLDDDQLEHYDKQPEQVKTGKRKFKTLLSLVILAGAGYLGFNAYQAYNEQAGKDNLVSTNAGNMGVAKHTSTTSAVTSNLSGQDLAIKLQNLQGQLQANQQHISELVGQVSELSKDLMSKDKAIASLQSQVNFLNANKNMSPQGAWHIAEVGFLLNVAQRKLQIDGDLNSTLVALRDAEKTLLKLNNANYTNLLNGVQKDIQLLENLPPFNPNAILTELGNLAGQVTKLPVRTLAEKPTEAVSENIQDWKTNLKRSAVDFMQKFVQVIPKNGESYLFSPADVFYVQENLIAHLNLASLALARNQISIYHQNLQFILQYLIPMFDGNSPQVKDFTSQLSKLNEQTLPTYPEQLSSLQLLRGMFAYRSQPSTSLSTPPSIPSTASTPTMDNPTEQATHASAQDSATSTQPSSQISSRPSTQPNAQP